MQHAENPLPTTTDQKVGGSSPSSAALTAVSRDIVDMSLRTWRTLGVGLVGPRRVDPVFGDAFAGAGEDPDVLVVDEE